MSNNKPADRQAVISSILIDNPNFLYPLREFADVFSVARSTLSEDIAKLKQLFKENDLGEIKTVAGAKGGIKYLPVLSLKKEKVILKKLEELLSDSERILPGGFIYLSDIIYSPRTAWDIARIFATYFKEKNPDYIVTIETKGIPLALMVAKAFSVPLVTIRRNHKVTEGSVVSINYISGSSNKIQTMSLARRALPENSKVLIIDDFMKAGGTVKGIFDLMKEFKSDVVGTGVLVETDSPQGKLVDEYLSLFKLLKVNEEENKIEIKPNMNLT
ncbi:MAG: pur operon repressor [Bacillota bacterium]